VPTMPFFANVDVGQWQPQCQLSAVGALTGFDVHHSLILDDPIPHPDWIMVTDSAPYQESADDGIATAMVRMTQTGPRRWEAQLDATAALIGDDSRIRVSAMNAAFDVSENRNGTQRIRFTATAQGGDQCFFGFGLYSGPKSAGGSGIGSASYSLEN
jgi:hypothetical protein